MTISKSTAVAIALCLGACMEDSDKPSTDGGRHDAGPRDAGASSDGSLMQDGGTLDAASADAGSLRWYASCGDPVCRPDAPRDSGVAPCDSSQRAPLGCSKAGAECDPGTGCGVLLRCTDSDPTMRAGGCPISRAAYKVDIEYLDAQAQQRYHDQVMRLGLAHYRYRDDPSAQERLGFIIEDVEPSRFVDEARDRVDMYAYTSALVAAMQVQEQRIRSLERELRSLRKRRAAAR